MSIPARQSTALELAIGPILDADGVAVTGGVVGDLKIKKTTGNFAALNASATLTHVSAGVYDLVLTTSDTDTVGLCCIAIDDTVNACASIYLQVMEEAVYDRDYAASATGIVGTAQTGDSFARIGATGSGLTSLASQASVDTIDNILDTEFPALVSDVSAILVDTGTTLQAELDAIQADVEDLQARTPAALGANGNLKADVRDWIGTAVATPTVAGVPEVDMTHISGTTANASNLMGVVNQYAGDGFFYTRVQGFSQAPTTIGSTGNDSTHIHLDNFPYGDDEINNTLIVIYDDSTAEYHPRWIEDWVFATKLATVATLPFTPQNATDVVYQFPIRRDVTNSSGAALATASALSTAQSDITSILADTNELQTDWVDGGRLDLILDARASQASLDTLDNIIDTEFPALVTEVGKIPKSDSTVTWNATALASIQSEANDAIVANNLDHLVLIAVDTNFATTVHADSVIGQLADNGAGFDRTTDSLEAIRDRGDAAWTTATGFSTHSAADVWAVATRVLTAGTNIQLPSNGLANVTAWTVNITGSLSGSVGSVTGAINTAAGVITTLDALDTAQDTQHGTTQTAVAGVPVALLDLAAGVETGLTLRQAMRLLAAAAAGELSGAATTTIVIRNAVADSKDRITATVDSSGNRSAITVDLT